LLIITVYLTGKIVKLHHFIPFYTAIPVNYHKITRMTLPVNTQICWSHKQRCSGCLPVRDYSHISTKIPVNSGVRGWSNRTCFGS